MFPPVTGVTVTVVLIFTLVHIFTSLPHLLNFILTFVKTHMSENLVYLQMGDKNVNQCLPK